MRRPPPRKPRGKTPAEEKRPRRLNGAVKDVASVAAFLGESEKTARAQIARGLIPYRQLGGRIVVIHEELVEYLRQLPGVTTAEALKNAATRAGAEGDPR